MEIVIGNGSIYLCYRDIERYRKAYRVLKDCTTYVSSASVRGTINRVLDMIFGENAVKESNSEYALMIRLSETQLQLFIMIFLVFSLDMSNTIDECNAQLEGEIEME